MRNALFKNAHFRIVGDRGLLVEYGNAIDPVVNQKVRAISVAAGKNMPPGVLEIVPAYRSLMILYDPLVTTPANIDKDLQYKIKNINITYKNTTQ